MLPNYINKMVAIQNHSKGTKISDLIVMIFSLMFFFSEQCIVKDVYACIFFLVSVFVIIVIKYLKIE